MAIIDLLLTIPAHSVECERGFSMMKKVKTDWRNKLNTDTLTSLVRVVMQTPDCKQFDPTSAILFWQSNANRKRRPFQPKYGPRKSKSTAEGGSNKEDSDGEESDMLLTDSASEDEEWKADSGTDTEPRLPPSGLI